MSKKRKAVKISLTVLNVLVIIGLGFSSVFYFTKYQHLKNDNLSTDQRIAKYQKEISKSYSLPSDEKPQLADVNAGNVDQLKKDQNNKDFFKDTQAGDVVLVYANNKLGILYRPKTLKIIKVGPVSFQVATVLVGAKADRDTAAAILKQAFSSTVNVALQTDAKTAVTTTTVVDVTGKNTNLVSQIAAELKGKVGTVPDGQDKPADGAGIAVYVGPTAVTP